MAGEAKKNWWNGTRAFGAACLLVGAVVFLVAARTQAGPAGAVDYEWQPIGISGGGGMFAPAISPIDPDLMMINCDMSGAYISRDGGYHWQMIHHLQLRGNTRCKPGFHPKDVNTIYAVSGWSGQLKVSHDGGKTWKKIGDLKEATAGEIAFDPDHPDTMLIGTLQGAWISRDAGNHWEKCRGVSGRAISFFVDRTSPREARVMFAATEEGVWRSDDGGRTWRKKMNGLPWPEVLAFAGGANRDTGPVLYCSVTSKVQNGSFAGGIYRSLDRGETWESAMGNGINTDTATADQWAEGPIAQYRHLLTTNTKPLTVYAFNTSTGFHPPHHPTVYRSDDGGENWRATLYADPRWKELYNVTPDWFTVSTGRTEVVCPFGAAISEADPERVMYLRGMCYLTHDGGKSWFAAHALLAPGQQYGPGCSWQNNGLVVTTTWHYYIDPHQPNRHYIAYTDIGWARSLDAGESWIWWTQDNWAPWRNTCYEVAFDPDIPGKMWAAFSNVHDIPNDNIISGRHKGTGPGGVCLSTDYGVSWKVSNKGLPVSACTSVVLDPRSKKGARTLYAAIWQHGVYKSTDDGKTWVRKSKGLGAPENMRVYRVFLHRDGTLFALITAKRGGGGYLDKGVGLYRSRDGGESWECITKSVGLLWPKDFSVSPRSSEVIFIGAADARNDQGGLWRTTDGGATWEKVAREGPQHFGAYFDPHHEDWVYMTLTESAPGPSLWLSQDGGQRVQFDPKDPDTLYVTTFGGSVFRGKPKR